MMDRDGDNRVERGELDKFFEKMAGDEDSFQSEQLRDLVSAVLTIFFLAMRLRKKD